MNRLLACLAAGLIALPFIAAAPALAAGETGKDPAQTEDQQKPEETPPPKSDTTKTEPKKKESEAKEAGREVAGTLKEFGRDVKEFFEGLFE